MRMIAVLFAFMIYFVEEGVDVSMSFDGIVTRAVVRELERVLETGRVAKIHQPFKTELVLVIRARGKNHKLLLSAHAQYARMHLVKETPDNPPEPPAFCMVLRKHLEGAVLESIEQVGYERIVHLNFRGKNDIGDDVTKRLVVEIMGKHSNIILVDAESQTIIDAVKRLSPAVNRHRTVLPGATYVSPPDWGKLDPAKAERDDFLKRLDFNAGKLESQISGAVDGFSPLIARELLHRAGLPTREAVVKAFLDLQAELRSEAFHPAIYRSENGKDAFHVLPMSHLAGEEAFASVSAMLEAFYARKAESDLVRQRVSDLHRIVTNEKKKNERKLKKLQTELREAEDAERYRLFGELLTANLHLAKKGDRELEAVNYYDEQQRTITIPLDPNKTPSENAQGYFRKYAKLKTAKKEIVKQIEQTREEIAYLESVAQQIETASLKDIAEIREELEEGGYVRRRTAAQRKAKPQRPEPERYVSSEGAVILVGKNNRQNDYLTTRLASPDDTWLHAKDSPGSHVVIRAKTFGERTLLEAAGLAAYFSKSRLSSRVPVDYTLIRHVRKPSGAKPGFVIYDHQKTVFVTPDESLVARLKENAKG